MGNTCPCFTGQEQTGALRKNNPEEQTRPRENKRHASFKKYGLSVHSADSAAKQADSPMPLPAALSSFIGSGMEGSGC